MGAAVWGRSDALLVFRGPTSRTGAVIAGLYEGQWAAADDTCVGGPSSTLPYFPLFETVGGLVGWQNRTTTLRALVGAAYAHVDWGGLVSGMARTDAAVPIASHLASSGHFEA